MVRRLGWVMIAYLGAGIGVLAFAPDRVVAWWDVAYAYLLSSGSQPRHMNQSKPEAAAPEPPKGLMDRSKLGIERPLKATLMLRTGAVPENRFAIGSMRTDPAVMAQEAGQRASDGIERPVGPWDLSKRRVELPLRRVIADRSTNNQRGPVGLEASRPTTSERDTPAPSATSPGRIPDAQARAKIPADWMNPPVTPGRVRWHPDFQAACQAAQRSGKPVLLFQLLGQLDQEFT